jgi:hypothetical protein
MTRNVLTLPARPKLLGLLALVSAVMFAALLAAAPAAHAQCPTLPAPGSSPPFGACDFSTSVSSTQAGAHADFTTSFDLQTNDLGNPIGQLKNVAVTLPPGEVGNPQAIPQCTDNEFQDFNCPADSQVGVIEPSIITAAGSQTSLTAATFGPTKLKTNVGPCSGLCDTVSFTVGSVNGIQLGDYLTICGVSGPGCDTGPGGQAEEVTVLTIDPSTNTITALTGGPVKGTCGPDTSLPTSVDFCPLSGMYYEHLAGDQVFDSTIYVGNSAGFEGYEGGNNITIGTPGTPDYESDTVAFYPGTSNKLELNDPLLHTHAAGEPVVHLATTDTAPVPIFNMQPDPGHVATLAATLLIATIVVEVDAHSPGTSDCIGSTCGLTATLSEANSLLTLEGTSLTLWGVPGDPSHDSQRCGEIGESCQPTAVSLAPFMTNPTSCATPMRSSVTVDSFENTSASRDAVDPAPTGCSLLAMSPTLSVAPDTSQADTPAGYDIDLGVPQNEQPYSVATPDVQNVSITLPQGTALSPPVANGLQGCTDAQFAADSCPNASKVGTVSITTPVLPDQLTGSVYIGSPTPSQMYRLFIDASGDNVTLHLSGQALPNPSTGQLTTTFDQNPELPFSDLNVKLFGGPLAALANPESCGAFTTTSDISSYSGGPDATPSSSFNITGCSSDPFSPTFTAGTTNATAGAFSPFSLTFSRGDSDQEFSSITATLPPGLFAKIAGVTQCSNADANAGTCPASSQVGTATVGSGAGSQPLFLTGSVYLTGPYNGGAYGLATVVPAIAGPYNLGTVVVRQSLRIDPNDAHVTAVSDPFPTILDGVPLRIKTVNLSLNRPDFIVNPTSCGPMQIGATITSVDGATDTTSSPFTVGGCGNLPFFPSLGIKLTGKGQTRSGKHPTLNATVKVGSGQANISSAKVVLPLSLALDPNNTKVVCSVADAAAINCPSNTIVGSVTATSPLLPDPLKGDVYLVQGIRTNAQGQQIRTLPSLLVPLKGDIDLNLHAQTSVSNGQLVSTFSGVPDAAVSNFQLTINGGSKGILVVTGRGKNICKGSQVATGSLTAHSGKVEDLSVKLGRPLCGATRHTKRTKKHKHHKK